MYSQITAFGRLTRDPELKYVNGPEGQVAVCNITIACDDRGGHSGKTHTGFLDFVFWARRGEVIADKLRKGDPILAFGAARTESWEDRDGKQHSRLRFRGTNFQFVPRTSAPEPARQEQRGRTWSGRDQEHSRRPVGREPTRFDDRTVEPPRHPEFDDSDIPF